MIEAVTPLILTYNEEANLLRTLQQLTWAKQILILDSGSTDGTLAIAKSFPQCQIITRDFDTFAKQCNFGLQQITTPWVLSLDADYVCDSSIDEEISRIDPTEDVAGFMSVFRYHIHGVPLRTSLYPPRIVLYRKDRALYIDEGHGHRVIIEGQIRELKTKIAHDDRKPLSRWFSAQLRYAEIEALNLRTSAFNRLNLQDRLRKMIIIAPPLTLLYCLFYKGLILDGWRGWYYTWQRVLAEIILSLCMLELKFLPPSGK